MTTSRMTAEQARGIALENDRSAAVDDILAEINKAAMLGVYHVYIRTHGFGTSCYCAEDKYPPSCQAILKDLRALGYRCNVRAREGQFVDLWLEIRWDEVKP